MQLELVSVFIAGSWIWYNFLSMVDSSWYSTISMVISSNLCHWIETASTSHKRPYPLQVSVLIRLICQECEKWGDKRELQVFQDLTFARVGGGHFGPPLWFFSDNSETTWVSALKLCIAVYSTFLHHVLFWGVRVRSGQVTRSPKLTPPLKKFKALSKAQLLSDRCKIYSTWRCHPALQNGYLGFFINVT